MKRDIELMRNILLEIESTDAISGSPIIEDRQKVEHLRLLHEAGWIKGLDIFSSSDGSTTVVVQPVLRLTNRGHDALAAIRDASVWARTKQEAAKVSGSVTLSVLITIATEFAKEKLGLK